MKPESLANVKQAPFPVGSGDWLGVRRTSQGSLLNDGRLVVWFSCGAASACALKLCAHMNPIAVYCDTASSEHPDNVRFRADVEVWTGIKVQVIGSKTYTDIDDVFSKTKYMAGINGARCTTELKKLPRFAFQYAEDTHVFGFTVDEKDRMEDFEADNFDMNLAWPLIQAGMTKGDCLKMIADAGIAIPAMYRLGFENNNCLGCVKATSPHYWNKIRKHFPDQFRQRAERSRDLGVRLVRYKGQRIFLDELPEDAAEVVDENLSCGPQCGINAMTPNVSAEPPPVSGGGVQGKLSNEN